MVGREANSSRSKIAYDISFAYFTLVQMYVLVLSFYLVVNAFSGGTVDFTMGQGLGAFLDSFFSSQAGIVVIALAGTYGVYVLGSFLYMDPWHIFTSSWAYFCGLTTGINILMVYAFCNWHDVSWGTKGSDKSQSLPSAQTQKDDLKSNFVEEIDKPQADIDSQFESTVKRALAPFEEPEEGSEKNLDDSYKAFRTNLVLLWIFSNLIVSLCITSEGINKLCLTVRDPGLGRLGNRLTEVEHVNDSHGVLLQGDPVYDGGAVLLPVHWGGVVPGQDGDSVLRQPAMMVGGWRCWLVFRVTYLFIIIIIIIFAQLFIPSSVYEEGDGCIGGFQWLSVAVNWLYRWL